LWAEKIGQHVPVDANGIGLHHQIHNRAKFQYHTNPNIF
jgi:hypothetical protein